MKKRLIIITGPTAVGKTTFAIKLAQKYETAIISVDSRQFYRELKIGTATPTEEELDAAPHYFIGNLSIHDYYNVAIYEKQALECLYKLFEKHDVVIAVGGSGLYIDALCYGIDDFPDANIKVREKIKKRFLEEGIQFLQEKVKKLDPEYYKTVDINNPKRLQRALEVIVETGKTYSSQRVRKKSKRDFVIDKFVLNMDRAELNHRINKRVDIMMEEGLEQEARNMFEFKDLNSLNTVGYKELFKFFDGEISKEQAITDIKTNSRRYAKRQVTWFKRYDDFKWINAGNFDEI